MRCPFCHKDNVRVIDTRYSSDGFVVRRRRTCLGCGKKFTTRESVVEASQIRVIKRDNSRVPFDRDKLRKGLERACWKRQISDTQILTLITQVEQDIEAAFETEVQSQFIGERVMHYLGELDQVAYVRFASVYRHFNDADDFVRELQRMRQNPDMPDLSLEYVPKRKTSQFPKGKHSRYNEQGLLGDEK
jgi:transcriptional repressor NrdR